MRGALQESKTVDAEVCGVRLQLHAEGGVFLPGRHALLVADLHLGKEATFRRHGIPVPIGSSEGTLQAVTAMLRRTAAKRLIILGDLFHARSSLSAEVRQAVQAFRDLHAELQIALVRGNHDRRVGALPEPWSINSVGDLLTLGRVTLAHQPDAARPEGTLLICGHIHPSVRLRAESESTGNLPCFWYSRDCLVIPAAGKFTGTCRIKPSEGDRVWVVGDGQVSEMLIP